MKLEFKLTEAEIHKAIIAYVKQEKKVDVTRVHLSYYPGSNDPRDYAHFSATAAE